MRGQDTLQHVAIKDQIPQLLQRVQRARDAPGERIPAQVEGSQAVQLGQEIRNRSGEAVVAERQGGHLPGFVRFHPVPFGERFAAQPVGGVRPVLAPGQLVDAVEDLPVGEGEDDRYFGGRRERVGGCGDVGGAVVDRGHQARGVDRGDVRIGNGPGDGRTVHRIPIGGEHRGRQPGRVAEGRRLEVQCRRVDGDAGGADLIPAFRLRNRLQPGFQAGGDAQMVRVEVELRQFEVRKGTRNGTGKVRAADAEILESPRESQLRWQTATDLGVVTQEQVAKSPEFRELRGDRARQPVSAQVEDVQLVQSPEFGRNWARHIVLPETQAGNLAPVGTHAMPLREIRVRQPVRVVGPPVTARLSVEDLQDLPVRERQRDLHGGGGGRGTVARADPGRAQRDRSDHAGRVNRRNRDISARPRDRRVGQSIARRVDHRRRQRPRRADRIERQPVGRNHDLQAVPGRSHRVLDVRIRVFGTGRRVVGAGPQENHSEQGPADGDPTQSEARVPGARPR